MQKYSMLFKWIRKSNSGGTITEIINDETVYKNKRGIKIWNFRSASIKRGSKKY